MRRLNIDVALMQYRENPYADRALWSLGRG
jgi:hypothetical protein